MRWDKKNGTATVYKIGFQAFAEKRGKKAQKKGVASISTMVEMVAVPFFSS